MSEATIDDRIRLGERRTPLELTDQIHTLSDATLGRLAVLDRLCEVMAANTDDDCNHAVDFGEVREPAFWRGLRELAHASAEATEEMLSLANELYDLATPSRTRSANVGETGKRGPA